MRLARLQTLGQHALGFDTETWAIENGNLEPPLVCGSAAWLEPGPRFGGALLDKQATLEAFARALEDPDAVFVGANIAFDVGVMRNEFRKRGVDISPWLFRALEAGRFFDLQVAEALHAIAKGHLGKDPRTMQQLKNPETGKMGSYSLVNCVDLVLGRSDAKANDEWRLRYKELDGVPVAQWPQTARDYPVDDARNQLEVALAQAGIVAKIAPQHDWQDVPIQNSDGSSGKRMQCGACGSTKMTVGCVVRRPHLNMHQVAEQTYSAIALHIGAMRGFRVDQTKVDKIEGYALRRRARLIEPFIAAGIVRAVGSENRSVLKRAIAVAFGASQPCAQCNGTGKVPSSTITYLRCPDCKGRCQPWKSGGTIKEPTVTSCFTCMNTAQVKHPNQKLVNCVIHGEGDDPDVKTCDGTGLHLVASVPRSDKDGISYGRDTCVESGDETLMSYGHYLEDAKVLGSYVPYLRRGRAPVAGHSTVCPFVTEDESCTCPGPYFDVDLTLRPNAVLETGRVSYRGLIQTMPRKPGFLDEETGEYIPSLRECFVARGAEYTIIEVPDNYVLQPGEERVAC